MSGACWTPDRCSTRLEAAGAVDVTAGADASLLADGDVTGYYLGLRLLGAERVVGSVTAGADGLVGGDGKLVVGGAASLEAGGAGTATFGDGLTVCGGAVTLESDKLVGSAGQAGSVRVGECQGRQRRHDG